jgi:type IV secretory pathway VirB3-like protein
MWFWKFPKAMFKGLFRAESIITVLLWPLLFKWIVSGFFGVRKNYFLYLALEFVIFGISRVVGIGFGNFKKNS